MGCYLWVLWLCRKQALGPRALTCYWPWAASSPCYFPVVGSALRWDPALCKVVSACRLSLCLPPSCNVCLILLSDCKVLFCRIQMTPPALSENMLESPGSITKQQKSAADRCFLNWIQFCHHVYKGALTVEKWVDFLKGDFVTLPNTAWLRTPNIAIFPSDSNTDLFALQWHLNI